MFKKLTSIIVALCMTTALFGGAFALNSTCQTGNEATFETLQEAIQNAPEIVKTYEGNDLDTMTKTAKVFGPIRRWRIIRKEPRSSTARPICMAGARRRGLTPT